MKLFESFYTRQKDKYERHKESMQSLGKCPDCSGAGFSPSFHAVYPVLTSFYNVSYDCPGCNGSGSYADWAGTGQ